MPLSKDRTVDTAQHAPVIVFEPVSRGGPQIGQVRHLALANPTTLTVDRKPPPHLHRAQLPKGRRRLHLGKNPGQGGALGKSRLPRIGRRRCRHLGTTRSSRLTALGGTIGAGWPGINPRPSRRLLHHGPAPGIQLHTQGTRAAAGSGRILRNTDQKHAQDDHTHAIGISRRAG